MRLPHIHFHRRQAMTNPPPSVPLDSPPESAPGPADLGVVADEMAVESLDKAIAAIEPYLQERIIPSRQVLNPLLDVWSEAQKLGPSVAQPVEELITVLVSRTTITSAELVATLDEVHLEALQVSLLIKS
jgi:hypothetical protein